MYEPLDLERVIWGDDLVSAVIGELERRGVRNPFIVVSPGFRRGTDTIDSLRSRIGTVAGVFDAIEPHVPSHSVMNLVGALRLTTADLIVTIGGGSTIDTVKVALAALAAGARTGNELASLAIHPDAHGQRIIPDIPCPPLRQIVVPTTLSGAEFSDLAGCTRPETRVKQLFSGRKIGSASVILDPAATIGTPLDVWLSTGLRALDHAVESICSIASNPLVDALSLEALRLLPSALLRTKSDPLDMAARLDAQLGVWLACSGLNRVPWGASHGLGHQLGAVSGIPHGYCSCILLPHVLAYNASANADRQQLVNEALGGRNPSAGDAVAELVRKLGLPGSIREVGIDETMLPDIASTSMDNMFVRQNPKPIRSPDELLEILKAAY